VWHPSCGPRSVASETGRVWHPSCGPCSVASETGRVWHPSCGRPGGGDPPLCENALDYTCTTGISSSTAARALRAWRRSRTPHMPAQRYDQCAGREGGGGGPEDPHCARRGCGMRGGGRPARGAVTLTRQLPPEVGIRGVRTAAELAAHEEAAPHALQLHCGAPQAAEAPAGTGLTAAASACCATAAPAAGDLRERERGTDTVPVAPAGSPSDPSFRTPGPPPVC